MSQSAQTEEQSTPLDRTGDRLRVSFDIEEASSLYLGTDTLELVMNVGNAPSYATVRLLTVDNDAVKDNTTPGTLSDITKSIRLRTRCQIEKVSSDNRATVFTGYVAGCSHQIGTGIPVLTLVDAKWILSKKTTFAQLVYNPEVSKYYFDYREPLIFNRFGQPNCIDSPQGPVFAPSNRFGYGVTTASSDEEPAVGAATSRARSWRVGDALLYLRNIYHGLYPDATAIEALSVDQAIPTSIIWPVGFGAGEVAGSGRKLNHHDIENMSLLNAITSTLRRAGHFDIYMQPSGDFQSTMVVKDLSGSEIDSGQYIYVPNTPSTDTLQKAFSDTCANAGSVNETIMDFFDETIIAGDPPALEHTLSTDTSGTGASLLEPAWSSDEETAFKDYITNGEGGGAPDTQQSFQEACALWPLVFSAYRIKTGSNIGPGSLMASGHDPNGHYSFMTHRLTSYNLSDPNPANWIAREITVEAKGKTGDFKNVTLLDGLSFTPDARIALFPALREQGLTWYQSGSASQYTGSDMTPAKIRLVAGIQGNGRSLIGQSLDNTVVGENGRVKAPEDGEKFIYTYMAKPGDYAYWERKNSSVAGSSNSSFSGNTLTDTVLFSDQPRITEHAAKKQKHFNRVNHTGEIIIPQLLWIQPGQKITVEGPNHDAVGITKTVTLVPASQITIVSLAENDDAEVYDNAGLIASDIGAPSGVVSPESGVDKQAVAKEEIGEGKAIASSFAPKTREEMLYRLY